MPQFDLSSLSSQFFWLFIVFGFLYLVVSKLIAPAAESILISRHHIMDVNVSSADEYNKKAMELEEVKKNWLLETNKLAEDIRHNALNSLSEKFESRKKEVSEELKLKTDHAMKDIDLFVDNFHAQETEPCITLAAFIIKKITGKGADMKLLQKIEEQHQ